MAVKIVKRSRLWTPLDLDKKPVLWVDCDSCKTVSDDSGFSAIYSTDGQVLRPLSGYTFHYWETKQNGRRWLGAAPDSTLPYRMSFGCLTSSGVFQGVDGVSAVGTFWRFAASNIYQTFWSVNNVSEDGGTAATTAAQSMLTLKPSNNATNIQWQARRITTDTHSTQTVNAGLTTGGLTCSQRLDAKNAKVSVHIGTLWNSLIDVSGVSTGQIKGCSNSAYQIMIGFQRDNVSGSNQIALGEAIFYAEALDDETTAKLEGYQAHKWGTQSALPAAHPYKTIPPLVEWEENIEEPGEENGEFTLYTAVKGDTWDKIALFYYFEEAEQTRIRDANPLFSDTLIFDGGEVLKIPLVDATVLESSAPDALTAQTAPWMD